MSFARFVSDAIARPNLEVLRHALRHVESSPDMSVSSAVRMGLAQEARRAGADPVAASLLIATDGPGTVAGLYLNQLEQMRRKAQFPMRHYGRQAKVAVISRFIAEAIQAGAKQ